DTSMLALKWLFLCAPTFFSLRCLQSTFPRQREKLEQWGDPSGSGRRRDLCGDLHFEEGEGCSWNSKPSGFGLFQ
ncbi:hypothetical protein HGM15179_001781, partial [Zosterops borbonicus]